MAFARKFITVNVQLENGQFSGGGKSATIKGHRVAVAIEQPGSPDMGKATVSIFGLPLDMMNRLTKLPYTQEAVGQNYITIEAGEEGGQSGIAFKGTIFAAFADIVQPIAALRIDALAGLYSAVASADPTSRKGPTDVANLMGDLAKMAQLTLENNGVNCKVSNPYLPSSPRQQIKALADAAGINWVIEKDTLAIWPKDGSRKGGAVKVGPKTGLVGYPRYTASGIEVTTVFNPQFIYGGSIEVESQLTPACGTWYIVNVAHEIECEAPGGRWFSILSCTRTKV